MKYIGICLIVFLVFCMGCKDKDKSQDLKNEAVKVIKPLVKDGEEKSEIEKKVNEVLDKDSKLSSEEKNKIKEELVKEAEKLVAEEVEEIPEIRLDTNDVNIEWAGQKGKVLKACAKSFSGNQKQAVMVLNDFTAKLYENGKAAAEMKAKKAVLYADKKEIKVLSGAKITSIENKAVLTANKILWKSNENKIYAKNGILKTEAGTITGKNFIVDTKLETFEVNDKNISF